MQKKKDVLSFATTKEFLKDIAGDFAFEVVGVCQKKKKNITDEIIGNALGLKITEIRAVLNRLHYRGIACYNKTRNPKTGWYSYTWNIKTHRIAELVLEKYAEELQKLERKKQLEKNYALFSCPKNCASTPFEVAVEYQFKCPECGKPMDALDSQKNNREINKRIKMLVKESLEIEKTT
jgi:transcription initiation factor TFIIE subunit alpha